MTALAQDLGYSARVRIHLEADGRRLRVSQVGRDFAILREACSIPPSTQGKIFIDVDGDVDEHGVFLPHGVQNSRYVEFF